jgi:hypothetical protein
MIRSKTSPGVVVAAVALLASGSACRGTSSRQAPVPAPTPPAVNGPVSAADSLELFKAIYAVAFTNGTGTAHSAKLPDVVCVQGYPPATDPPPSIITALQENRTLIVRKFSACTMAPMTASESRVIDTLTGKRGISISVSALVFTDADNFTVNTGYYQHGLSAAGWTCVGRRTSDRRWEITRCTMRWIS